ncbi:NHLP leader peptide family RiPP precursor [Chryseobacterium arthrosphaerae]|uniref:NHLP leader peptide family RiPP n=1 Tax=Chryseobacterium arthrosphaerae TaxID=651561 RepID=A0A1B8ZI25_9FLAO|nr:NHLP leader peptide family RiPP precursor [Chryseobacterium arthrosphaerae]AYZ14353.1 NHLP leader peptide family natural product precursor [Chryseobacterium arthrosphaerae]OCA71186.1 TOMM propeptide domain-containing protein [Chryseobacterium arthrosphaerae]
MEDKKEQIIQTIISKAWEDAEFRKELLSNPVETIEKLAGVVVILPEGKELVIVDQTDKSKVYVNIPAEPEIDNLELTEDQLEIIAGGGQMIWKDLVNSIFPALKDCIKLN